MNLNRLIKSRRTIHRYLDKKVPPEIVLEALEAAHFAPNHKHTWPWRFTVVGPQCKVEIDQTALAIKSSNGPLQGQALNLFQEKRVNPSLIVVSQMRTQDVFQSKEDYAAIACAIQNLSLVLHDHGVGSKWSSGSLIRSPKVYKILGINAQEQEIVAFLWYGYASYTPKINRPSLESVMTQLS
jgi:nitroreductase